MKLRPYQIELINKTREAFRTHKRLLIVLPCGAGKTVCFADMAQKHIKKFENGNVWFLVHRKELIGQTEKAFETLDGIFIGMVQTITRHPERYKKPTLIVFDEAHHAKAKSWTDIIEYFNDVPMIGLTATPIRKDGKPLGDIFNDLIVGVESEWLIENHYLAPYDYFAPQASLLEYQVKGTDYDLDDVTAQLLKSKIYGDIGKYIDNTRKTIIYCPSIQFSKLVCERYGATHFDGSTPEKERNQIVEDFRNGKIMILSNVDLIGEGFDVPDCEVVILLRPTMSLSLFIQQSMRCLRYIEGKRATIYDLVGNVYRHGMPTDKREWSINEKIDIRNKNGEPEVIARQCKQCRLVYSGNDSICPYCGHDNGQTRKQIEEAQQVELEQIRKVELKKARMEVGRESSEAKLIEIGKKRGYKNPQYWAKMIIANRKRRI